MNLDSLIYRRFLDFICSEEDGDLPELLEKTASGLRLSHLAIYSINCLEKRPSCLFKWPSNSDRVLPDTEISLELQDKLSCGSCIYERNRTCRFFIDRINGQIRILEIYCQTNPDQNTLQLFSHLCFGLKQQGERGLWLAEKTSLQHNLQQSLATRAQLLGIMSHEFRAPINGILGFAQLLLDSSEQEEMKRSLHHILESGEHLIILIDEILDYSSLLDQNLKLDDGLIELRKIAQRLEIAINHRTTREEQKLEINLAPNLPRVLKGDGRRLQQMLYSLLILAQKLSTDRFVVLKIKSEPASFQQTRLVIIIRTALSKSTRRELKRLMQEPLLPSVPSSSELAICISRQLCQFMEGSLELIEEENKVQIKIQILARNALDQSFSPLKPLTPLASPEAKTSLRLLLAEANPINQKVIHKMLLKLGYLPRLVTSSQDLITTLQKERFDLLLLDTSLHDPDCLATTIKIRNGEAGENHRDLFILALSTDPNDVEHKKIMQAGINDFLAKPIKIKVLEQKLESALSELV